MLGPVMMDPCVPGRLLFTSPPTSINHLHLLILGVCIHTATYLLIAPVRPFGVHLPMLAVRAAAGTSGPSEAGHVAGHAHPQEGHPVRAPGQ